MSTEDVNDPQEQQREVNRQFLTAIYLGRPDEAAAIYDQVDWSQFTPNESPMERVLNPALFVSRTLIEHAENNRRLVAEFAADHFDFGEHRYEDSQGWEHTSHGDGASSDWHRTIYVRPSWVGEDDEDASTSATMRVDFVETKKPWELDGCALTNCEVVDYSGNDYGSLPNLAQAHRSAAYGVTADKMPDFVRQVMQWCIESNREDLIAVNAAALGRDISTESRARSALTESYSNYILYRAAKLGQVDVVETALRLGCNPLETLELKDGPSRSPLDYIEKLQGDPSALLIRSIMARQAANLAMDELSVSQARPGL